MGGACLPFLLLLKSQHSIILTHKRCIAYISHKSGSMAAPRYVRCI